jgi:hypothetical protein
MSVWSLGAVVLLVSFAFAQRRFYVAHRARYGTWRNGFDRFVGSGETFSVDAVREGVAAHFRRVDDVKVEHLRRLTLSLWLLFAGWAVGVGFATLFTTAFTS